MKQEKSQGSIVLIVLMTMALLMVLLHAAITRESFLKMALIKQVKQQKDLSLCRGLLHYGVRVAKSNYDTIMKDGHELALELHVDQRKGAIFLTCCPQGITIRTELRKEAALINACSCLITQNSDKKFSIESFQR